MNQADFDAAMADGREVARAFTFVEQTYSRTPCRECKGRQTVGTVITDMVVVACEACGGATRIGALANLWSPGGAPETGPRPILRAAPETDQQARVNGRGRYHRP